MRRSPSWVISSTRPGIARHMATPLYARDPDTRCDLNHFEARLLRLLASFSATRAFTIFFTRTAGSGLSTRNCSVPFDVRYPCNSSFIASVKEDCMGKKLQWFLNAAYATSAPL